MVGARAEANLGVWDVTTGNYDFSLTLPSIGVSYVNKYFTNYDLTRTSNPFGGVVEHNPPSDIYIRFSDGSPENPDGARLFSLTLFIGDTPVYSFTGGREPLGILTSFAGSSEDGQSRWVDTMN